MSVPANSKDSIRSHNRPQLAQRECTLCGDAFADYPGCVLIAEGLVFVLCNYHLHIHAKSRIWFNKLLDATRSQGMPLCSLELLL